MPADDLAIAKYYSLRPPFSAMECAYELGLKICYAPIPAAIECHFKKKPYILRVSDKLKSGATQRLRLAVSVGIAHYLLHRDIMENEPPHGDAIFVEFQNTGRPLSVSHEDQAMRIAMNLLVPQHLLDPIVHQANCEKEAKSEIVKTFNISKASAEIFMRQAARRSQTIVTSHT